MKYCARIESDERRTLVAASVKSRDEVIYPTSDGKPMAETDFHCILMMALRQTLDHWFSKRPRVYVSGNLLMYYVPGDKRKHVSPDVFVVKGVAKKKRLCYLTWKERKNPSTIIEITSSSTRNEDQGKKFVLYRDVLKVKEYYLFDPFGDWLKPRLKGYRLENDEYVPIALVDDRMPSLTLGLHFQVIDDSLRLYDPKAGEVLLTPDERAAQAEAHAAQVEREKSALAEENERLRQQLNRMLRDRKNGS
jgi:Uma2 family endonuclease